MGMALTPCITPAAGKPSFELADDEMEIGIGIHGEPGRERDEARAGRARSPSGSTTPIVEDLPFSAGDKVLAFVNGMGGTPLIELYIVYNEVAKLARRARASRSTRNLVGNYITSLEMAGCSITLLKLDDELTRCGTRRCTRPRCAGAPERWRWRSASRRPGLAWMTRFAGAMAEHRSELTELDTAIGDGDHGTNMDRGMQQGAREARRGRGRRHRRRAQDGRHGAGLHRRRRRRPAVRHAVPADGHRRLAGPVRARSRRAAPRRSAQGIEGVQARGKAEPGDKTMVDALDPGASRRWSSASDPTRWSCAAAAAAAEEGMEATIPLVARKGRASYLGERSADHQDPGATSTYYLLSSAAADSCG